MTALDVRTGRLTALGIPQGGYVREVRANDSLVVATYVLDASMDNLHLAYRFVEPDAWDLLLSQHR